MTDTVHTIDLGSEFARLPFGRHPSDGPNNGERFREEFIVPALEKFDKIVVVFDNAHGVGPSFLDEAFGVLVDRLKLTIERFEQRFEFKASRDPAIVEIIRRVVGDHVAPGAPA